MPRLQVYLPDDLYHELKKRNLPASEMLQAALRTEIERLDLLAATDAHLAGLANALQRATAADHERADIIVRRLSRARFGG